MQYTVVGGLCRTWEWCFRILNSFLADSTVSNQYQWFNSWLLYARSIFERWLKESQNKIFKIAPFSGFVINPQIKFLCHSQDVLLDEIGTPREETGWWFLAIQKKKMWPFLPEMGLLTWSAFQHFWWKLSGQKFDLSSRFGEYNWVQPYICPPL